ncbi:hypothetical protein CHL76_11400 [Marinococcus halophilus]|uniref:Uncharacterized protein n=1 Tax=Marinococcus halophilus TaxID=1371 RepID=A0A510Y8S4_MARHA|nr:hypothetical protein [Marinococcus halophilus]OZT79735.1 hypothetical protein CHL76_11400 [Marinococcus halophilus]GEK59091.1 hypothetical protein MHA01_19960 [Marinococcus halophilus]
MYSRVFVDEHWNLVASIIGNFAMMFAMLVGIDSLSAGEPSSMASKVSVAAAIALLLCVGSVRKFRKYREEE